MTDELKFFDPETGKPLHRVPEGVTIPNGMPCGQVDSLGMRWYAEGMAWDTVQHDYPPRFTREPIAPPKPLLPTEPGAMIRAVDIDGDECAVMVRGKSGYWHGVDQDGDERFWGDESITSWKPVTAIPTETWDRLRVLDPEDTRDQVDRDGDLMRFATRPKARWGEVLATVHWHYGPLRFADEVSGDE